MGQDVPHTPVAGVNVSIPIFRWGARFKTNRQQKAYIGIQKLQQSYVTDNILEELSAATTKLTETEQQVKTARGNRYSNWRVSDKKMLIFAFPMLWKKLPMTICAPTNGNMATAMRTPLEAISINSSSLVKMADMAWGNNSQIRKPRRHHV